LNNKKNILIVGGTGFIGYHLAVKCLNKGWKVTSISTKLPKTIRYLSKVNYIICDIANKKSLVKKVKKNFDYVVNLGGHVDHSNKKKTFLSHYIGCKNLAEVFKKKNIKAFVQMGSCIENGKLKSPQIENLTSRSSSIKSIYGKAKLLSSIYLLKLYKNNNFPCVILRLYLAYGPKQDVNRFIPIITNGCIRNTTFPCSKGDQLRDFIYISDVVDAIIKSLRSKKAKGQIINIGTGKPKKIKDLINYIKKVTKGGQPEFGKIKYRKDEMIKLYPRISKAKNLIGWKPKVSFNNGLKRTIKYYYESIGR